MCVQINKILFRTGLNTIERLTHKYNIINNINIEAI